MIGTKLTGLDAYSGVMSAARAVLEKLGNIDLRNFSFGQKQDVSSIVNWDEYMKFKDEFNDSNDLDYVNIFLNVSQYS